MKILSAVTLVILVGISGANAQNRGTEGGAVGGAAAGIVGGALVGGPIGAVIGGVIGATAGGALGTVTNDDRAYVQRYVYERQVPTVALQEPVMVGRPLPRNAPTYVIEGNDNFRSYRYAYVNGQYLLIDSNGNVLGSIER